MDAQGEPGGTGSAAPWVSPDATADVPDHAVLGPGASVPAVEARSIDEPPVLMRPMTMSDLLDGAFAVIKRSPGQVLGAAAVVVVPIQVLGVFLQRDTFADLDGLLFGSNPLTASQSASTASASDFGLLLLVAALSMIIPLFLGAVLTSFVTGWYAGAEVTASGALRTVFARSGGLFVVWLVLSPLTVVAYVLDILPSLVPVAFFLVTVPAMVAERIGPFAAMGRSAKLVATRFWWAVLLILLGGLVATVLETALPLLPQILGLLLPDPFRWMVIAASTAAVSVLVDTAVIAATVLFYVDLRIRTEGLDLELRMPDAFGSAS